ncbi:MAG: CaiB/BaiF CoA-transferase family protein [Burkholderiales bacterium]|jgi:crotonobetainyl-CoA:carnitine CoA-transferase CaiB-like acyl-CoA transferase|nr:CaiB/BaiF CoA-transferase family protein [Burkholderiales bacterium]
MSGPLSHIRVLDLSRVLAGPWCGQNLADLGAEVIKVERPKTGDDSRAYGPPWMKNADGEETSEGAYFMAANRGKKSLTINLNHAEGQRLVRELAAQCDVLIENYKYGDLERYGLGYAALAEINPGLIYCSVTGFGQTGPYRERPGYDFMAQGMAGLMSLTGEPDGAPGAGPMRVGVPVIDIFTGMYATIAICAAVANRAVTGKGQHLDVALLDSCVALLANQGMTYLATGESPKRIGNTHPSIVPYQVFPTADGAIILACGNDNLFSRFCKVAGREDLISDARFAKNVDRVRNRTTLVPILEEVFRQRGTEAWVEALEEAGVPSGPINNVAQAFANPQVQARGMQIELPHPLAGTVPLMGSPMKFSGTPIEHKLAPPVLGQHADEILEKMLGLGESERARLRAAGAI